MLRIEGNVSVGCPPQDEGWKSFMFHFHDFANLSTTRNHYVASPKFTCSGHQWQLRVYPGGGGHSDAAEGNVSLFLYNLSEKSITTRYGMKVIDKFGKARKDSSAFKHEFTANKKSGSGWPDFISRSDILDDSQNILDSNGTLTVVVYVEEEPTTVFVPDNPLVKRMQGMFNDQDTADVCFEVNTVGEKKDDDDDDDGNKRAKTTTPFYAHRTILQGCAPMLAAICGSNNERNGVVTAPVNDVRPYIFLQLLLYAYGFSLSKDELKTHSKDIIDAADKYSIVNLKLAAEAAYVESTDISLDNAMDNLLYADAMNLALLKEAVMNFLADNHCEAAERIDFTGFPAHVVKDLLVAFSRNSKKGANGTNVDELTTLSVSTLRRKLDQMGEEVDGSREAMIQTIKSHSEEEVVLEC